RQEPAGRRRDELSAGRVPPRRKLAAVPARVLRRAGNGRGRQDLRCDVRCHLEDRRDRHLQPQGRRIEAEGGVADDRRHRQVLCQVRRGSEGVRRHRQLVHRQHQDETRGRPDQGLWRGRHADHGGQRQVPLRRDFGWRLCANDRADPVAGRQGSGRQVKPTLCRTPGVPTPFREENTPMLKRFARLHVFALFGGLLLASACTAQSSSSAPYTEGTDYITLPAPHQRYSNSGKVEVVEVFSYACIHCAQFAPEAEKLRKELPPGAEFKLMPAPFNAEWVPFARAYYAARELGVVDRTHLQLFVAKFGEHYPINSMDELADFYAREGVNRADFMRIATSEATTAKMKR